MQKIVQRSLIATAVAAAIGFSGIAAADTTAYGKIHASFGSLSQDVSGTKDTVTAASSHASRVGIKGDTMTDSGLSVIGQAEFEFDTTGHSFTAKSYTVGDATNTTSTSVSDTVELKSRNMFVGVKGDFGTVLIGNVDTPHKSATGKLDPFSDTYADYNNVVLTDTRAKDALAYIGQFGGIGFSAAYAAGDDSITGDNKGSATSVAVTYESGPLYLAGAVESFADAAAGASEGSTKFGVGYKVADVKLALVYDVEKFKGASDGKATWVSADWAMSSTGSVRAAYGKFDAPSTSNDPTFYAVGYDYKLAKSADVYVLYASGDKDGLKAKGGLAGKGKATVVGMQYGF